MDTTAISEFIEKHRTAVIIGAVVIVLFIAFSVASYNRVHQADTTNDTTIEQNASPENEAVSKLNDSQKEKLSSYDSETTNVISVLKANLWSTEDKQYLVSFTDQTYTERTSDGVSSTTAYVVDAVKKTTDNSSDDGVVKTTYDLAVETSDSSFFITLEAEQDSSGNLQYFLDCSKFKGGSNSYSPISASNMINVNGLNQDITQLIDNKQDELEQQLKEYCSTYYPAAVNIDWAEYATIDWSTNTVLIPFTLDDSKSSTIYAEYDRQAKTFQIYGQSNFKNAKTANSK